MKILRFNDNRIGVLKGEDRVVDVSGEISYRVEKGPKRAIEEVIEGFEQYRDKFQRIVDRENGVPLNTVKSHILRGKERMARLLDRGRFPTAPRLGYAAAT